MDFCKKTQERNVKEVCAAVLRDWGEEESDAETEDTQSRKRKRHEPHVEGNYATFVYIPVIENRSKIREKLLPAAAARLQHLCEKAVLFRQTSAAATKSREGKQQEQPYPSLDQLQQQQRQDRQQRQERGYQQQEQQHGERQRQCGEQQEYGKQGEDGEQQQDGKRQNSPCQREPQPERALLPVEQQQQQQSVSVLRQRQLTRAPSAESADASHATSSSGGASTPRDIWGTVSSGHPSGSCSSGSRSGASSSSSDGGSNGSNSGSSTQPDNGSSSSNSVGRNWGRVSESPASFATRRYISSTSPRSDHVSGSGRTCDSSNSTDESSNSSEYANSGSGGETSSGSSGGEDASSNTGDRSGSSSSGRSSGVGGAVAQGGAPDRRKCGAGGIGDTPKPQQQQQDRKGGRQRQEQLQETQEDARPAALSGLLSPSKAAAAAATASHTQLEKEQLHWDVVKEEEGNFHISLCRTFMLQFHLIKIFVERMKEKLLGFRRFTLELDRKIEIFSNKDSSCFFAAAPVTRTCVDRLMMPLYEGVDEVVCAFGGLPFYQPCRPHLSLAWTLQDLRQVLDSPFRSASEPPVERDAVKEPACNNRAATAAPETTTGTASVSDGHQQGKLALTPCEMADADDEADCPVWLRVNCICIRVGKVVTTVSLLGAHTTDKSSSDESDEN